MAEANMNYLYTIGGYATLFGVGYAIYHVSTQKDRKRSAASQAKSAKPTQSEPRKEDRKKKQRMESFTSETQGSPEKMAKTKTRANASESSSFLSNVQGDGIPDDNVDNREFAKQLSKAKQGTQFAMNNDSGKQKQKEKSVKQSRASVINAPAVEKTSAPSSNAGAVADDDQSLERSPVAEPADAGGVADMLEPAAAAPSVLRLTDTESKSKNKNKKPKAAKAAEQVETKKQRQNRKKAEAARAAREEAEKERKSLEEKQRRAARIADGRPAKDGSQYTASAVKNSAWDQGAPNGATNGASATSSAPNGPYQLLDTFDAPVTQTTKPSEAPKPESAWMSSLPSEEEQLEMLKNETDEWSTVKAKSSKKSAKKASSAASSDDAPAQTRPAVQPKQPAPVSNSNNTPKHSQNFGAFSALTSNDEPAEEVEEEWDV